MNDTDSAPAPTRSGALFVVEGKPVSIPVVVRDAAAMSAMFIVPSAAVRQLIADRRLQVAELLPRRTLCVLAGVEYRDNDLGIYNEVSIAFFVRPGSQPPTPLFGLLAGMRRGDVGAYIHRLPVTTSFSCAAGRDIWGFPKTVEQIDFRDEGPQRVCTLACGGAHVLTMSVARGGRRAMPEAPQTVYALRNGTLWKTPSVMAATGVGMHLGGARLTLGRHPIADELRQLGLPRRAVMSTWMTHMQARFDAPIQMDASHHRDAVRPLDAETPVHTSPGLTTEDIA